MLHYLHERLREEGNDFERFRMSVEPRLNDGTFISPITTVRISFKNTSRMLIEKVRYTLLQ